MNLRLRHEMVVCLLLGLLTVAGFYQVANHEFVDYDDDHYLTQNPNVQRGLTFESVSWAFGSVHAANWHPLTWLSHMLDWQLWGNRPRGHHLTNLAIHVVNAWLLFLVLHRMTSRSAAVPKPRGGNDAKRRSGARGKMPASSENGRGADMLAPCALVAALFAVHPLHVESVAWVSERKDTLSTMCWLLTMAAYLWYVARPSIARYLLVALGLAAGLLAKQMVVTLPLILLLLDYWPLRRWGNPLETSSATGNENPRRRWPALLLEKVPLLALAAVGSVLAFLAQKEGSTPASLTILPVENRLANATLSYVAYLGKTVWPVDLICLYPHRLGTPGALKEALPIAIAAFALLVAITVMVAFFGRRRYLLVGWLWYLGTLVPVSGIVQVGTQSMADRFTYVPLIGVFIMLAFGLADLLKLRSRRFRVATWSCAALVVLVLAGQTWRQVRVWRDSQSLFGHAIAVMPDNAFAHTEMAAVMYKANDLAAVEHHAREALRIEPGRFMAHNNLAVVLSMTGRPLESLKHLRVVMDYAEKHPELPRGGPNWALTANNLAWQLATHRDPALRDGNTAVELVEKAIESTGQDHPAYLDTLAAAYAEVGRFDEAVSTATRALKLARGAGMNPLADDIAKRLARFREGKPWRE